MNRPGNIELHGGRYRLRLTIDGKRRTYPLYTASRDLAERYLSDWRQHGTLPPPGSSVADAAERTYRLARSRASQDQLARLRNHVLPTLGERTLQDLTPRDISQLLRGLAETLAPQTVSHIRQALINVYEAEECPYNPAREARLPRAPRAIQRVRSVLTDEELLVYLAWQHPWERERMAVLERQVMACVARLFGGLRTGDLHAMRWDTLDVPAFAWGWAPRAKTKAPQRLAIPEQLRPILRDWWDRHGRPTSGPVFPVRRGDTAGAHRGHTSHAKAFRADLARAFGVQRWEWTPAAWGGQGMGRGTWTTAREHTSRERELLLQTPYTLPVDWHSWRRAYSQAVGSAMTPQDAMRLTGHASLGAYQRYLERLDGPRELPVAAQVLGLAEPRGTLIQGDFSGADGTRTRGLRRDRPRDGGKIAHIGDIVGRTNTISVGVVEGLAQPSGLLSVAARVADVVDEPTDGLDDASGPQARDGSRPAG